MTTTTNEELIAEARLWPRDGVNEGTLINALADALAAVPAPTEADREALMLWRVQYEDQSRDCDGVYLLTPHYVLAPNEDEAWNRAEEQFDTSEGCPAIGVFEARPATEAEAAEWLAGPPPVPAPKTQDGEAREAEWEYGIRADGDDEPWSDISDDLDWLVSETTSGPGFEHSEVVRRRKAGPWLPVSPEGGETK